MRSGAPSQPPQDLYRDKFLAGPAEIPENEIQYNENDVLGKGEAVSVRL